MNLKRKKINRQRILPFILIMALLMLFSGCQKKPSEPQQPVQGATAEVSAATEQVSTADDTKADDTKEAATEQTTTDSTAAATTQTDSATEQTSAAQPASEPQSESTASSTADSSQEQTLPEDGTYTTKDDVALYIHTYGELPQNFITKKAAKKLGWQGGSLEDYAPGKCIGGDYFGNYEGLLPEDKEYHECDIDTLGKSKRGAKRIIYSDDGYIYYTDDHYKSFQLLYEP